MTFWWFTPPNRILTCVCLLEAEENVTTAQKTKKTTQRTLTIVSGPLIQFPTRIWCLHACNLTRKWTLKNTEKQKNRTSVCGNFVLGELQLTVSTWDFVGVGKSDTSRKPTPAGRRTLETTWKRKKDTTTSSSPYRRLLEREGGFRSRKKNEKITVLWKPPRLIPLQPAKNANPFQTLIWKQ